MTRRFVKGRALELRPFKGDTLTDVINYLRRDVARALADLFAVLKKPDERVEAFEFEAVATAIGNVDSVAGIRSFATRVMDYVTVTGSFVVNTTVAGQYSFQISLPFPRAFESSWDLNGLAVCRSQDSGAIIVAESSNGTALVAGDTNLTTGTDWVYTYTYRVPSEA